MPENKKKNLKVQKYRTFWLLFCWQSQISGLCRKWNWLSLGSKSNTLVKGSFWPTTLALCTKGTSNIKEIADTGAGGGQNAEWCQWGKQVTHVRSWQAGFSHYCFSFQQRVTAMSDIQSSLFKIACTQDIFHSDGEE